MFRKPESEELEKDVEGLLVKEIKKCGGKAYKFNSPSRSSVPDRLCLLPGNEHFFVECKKPKATRTPLQRIECKQITDLGHKVFVLHSRREVLQFMIFLEEGGLDA